MVYRVFEFHFQSESGRYKFLGGVMEKTDQEMKAYLSTPNEAVPNEGGDGTHTPIMRAYLQPGQEYTLPSGKRLTWNTRLRTGYYWI